jgi:hypothetical protein
LDLNEYLATEKTLREFDEGRDEKAVQDLLSARAMNVAGIHLVYQRTPRFLRLLEWQGRAFKTILGVDGERVIGLFSVSAGEKYIQGVRTPSAYIGDFRTDGSPSSARAWRRTYTSLLRALAQNENLFLPRYFLTAILANNKLALRNIAQPKKNFGFRYHLLKVVPMVNIYGHWPGLSSPAGGVRIRQARAEEETLLRQFLDSQEQRKAFGSVCTEDPNSDWNYRKQHWPGFAAENFLIAETPGGRWLGVTLPWSPGPAKRMFVRAAPKTLVLFFSFLRLLGYNMPRVGEAIEACYLTHLNFIPTASPPDIVPLFLDYLLKHSRKKYHMFSFADWWGVPLKKYVKQKIPVNLYAVSTDENFDPRPLQTEQIGFEMGLV